MAEGKKKKYRKSQKKVSGLGKFVVVMEKLMVFRERFIVQWES